MTALTTTAGTTRPAGTPLRQAMVAEWIKLTSVRSHRVTLAAFAILSVGVSIAVKASNSSNWAHESHAGYDATNQALAGLAFGQLAVGVLGILVITGEYSSGSIRSTLAAVPRRSRMLAAKAAVFWAAALVACEAVTWLSFLAGNLASGRAPHASLGQPGVARAVLLTGVSLSLLGLFAMGIGTLVRNSAGAIAIFVGVLLVLPLVLSKIDHAASWYTPESILSSSVSSTVGPWTVGPGAGFGLLVLYTAVLLGAGLVVLNRRDA